MRWRRSPDVPLSTDHQMINAPSKQTNKATSIRSEAFQFTNGFHYHDEDDDDDRDEREQRRNQKHRADTQQAARRYVVVLFATVGRSVMSITIRQHSIQTCDNRIVKLELRSPALARWQ